MILPFVVNMRSWLPTTVTSSQSILLLVSVHSLSIQVAYNILHSLDHVAVKHFDETSIYQVSIGDEEWFTRYEFLYDARRISVSSYFSFLFLSYTLHPAKGNPLCMLHMQGAIYPRRGQNPSFLSSSKLLQVLPPVMLGKEWLCRGNSLP